MDYLRAALGAFLGFGLMIDAALAQSSIFDRLGVRHSVTVSVAPALPSNQSTQTGPDAQLFDLMVTIRISDHARETQFFGDIPVTWPEFPAAEGAPEKEIWKDEQCHQRRGLPKATIAAIEGVLEAAKARLTISARPRHRGQRLPFDEIRQPIPQPGGRDDLGQYLAYRVETTESHVIVLLKIYAVDCVLK
jgi:hypothetical protein